MNDPHRRVYVRRVTIGGPQPPSGPLGWLGRALAVVAALAFALLLIVVALPLFLLFAVAGTILAAWWGRRIRQAQARWREAQGEGGDVEVLEGDYRVVDDERPPGR